jgi:hypothetical protein
MLRVSRGRSVRIGSVAIALGMLLGVGCQARGIGDPCIPEAIPTGGFDDREIYVETSSVQCRTRTCMVFRLDGDPSRVAGEDSCPPGTEDCVDRNLPVSALNSAERVFCSCRCSAAGGDVNTPLCACTDGFHCVDVLTAGGVGVRGGYCVPNDLCTADEDCVSGRCNLDTGVCNLPT